MIRQGLTEKEMKQAIRNFLHLNDIKEKYNCNKKDISNDLINYLYKNLTYEIKKTFAQRGARTHDPEIKSLVLYRLS